MLEALATFFAFGSLAFWITAASAALLLMILVGSDNKFWAFLVGVTALVCLGASHVGSAVNFVIEHPAVTIASAVLYFALGAAWSVFKWFKYLVNWRDERLQTNMAFSFTDERIPKAAEHKSDITGWIIFWPLSAIAYLVWDLIADIANRIYKLFAGLYDQVTNYVFKDVRQNATIHKLHND